MQNSILLVDDQKENITNLKGILDDNYQIYAALNGESALKVMEKNNIDLVLLDLVMPVMDGFETITEMKKNPKLSGIPVIFITAEDDAFNEAKGLALGAMDYVKKPYDPDIVQIKVKNQIEHKMYRDNLEHLVEERTKEVVATRDAIIIGMSLLAEGRDKETGTHIKKVQHYTEIIAREITRNYPERLPKSEADKIIALSPLHDIGKVFVSDTILLKPSRLTDEEFELIKSHTFLGADVLVETEKLIETSTSFFRYAVEMAGGHHEKYDGSGYPHHLKGEDIPLSAGICAIADIYEALTSERPYKKAFTHEEACKIILEGDGRVEPSHFHPCVLEAFKVKKNEINACRIKINQEEIEKSTVKLG